MDRGPMTQQSLITRLKAVEEALANSMPCAKSDSDYNNHSNALSDLRDLIREAEGQCVAYVIPERFVNDIQANSISTMIARAKRAHYCNVYLRINGKDELYEADWIKHLTDLGEAVITAAAEQQQAKEKKG